ncbi:hypothetical protein BaRGS_00019098 [Batillaria attramentaria]|uniref:Uncharacterized protein n=1 Tax=Batillaria attramentaria TaxID=370345 RepID=A0ABD0KRX4_9CAEN
MASSRVGNEMEGSRVGNEMASSRLAPFTDGTPHGVIHDVFTDDERHGLVQQTCHVPYTLIAITTSPRDDWLINPKPSKSPLGACRKRNRR